MTEPNKIFRSGCQEKLSYGDNSFSRHYKYTMHSVREGTKNRRILLIFLCILVFLLISLLFIYVGLVLYPYLIPDCKSGEFSGEHESNSKNNVHYVPILSELFSAMGICNKADSGCFCIILKLNKSKIEIRHGKNSYNIKLNGNYECSISGEENLTDFSNFHWVHICKHNFTVTSGTFKSDGTRRNIEKNDNKTTNMGIDNESYNLDMNNTESMREGTNLQSKYCNCSAPQCDCRITQNYCICEIYKPNVDVGETKSENEQHGKSLDIRKCQCPYINNDKFIIPFRSDTGNESSEVNFRNGNECICPDTVKISGWNISGIEDGKKTHIMESMTISVVSDAVNSPFNGSENLNEGQSLINQKCACPSVENATDDDFNRTKLNDGIHGKGFQEYNACKCPEAHNIDLNETRSETDLNYTLSSNYEECECPVYTEQGIKSVKIGIKTITSECMCPKTKDVYHFNTTKMMDGNIKYDNHSENVGEAPRIGTLFLNDSETINKNQSLNGDRCVCPKTQVKKDEILNGTNAHEIPNFGFMESGECKCSDTKIMESTEFHQATVTKNYQSDFNGFISEECECPNVTKLSNNGSKVKSSFKTADGKCVCPETPASVDLHEIHVNETEAVREKKIPIGDGTETLINKEMSRNGDGNELPIHKEVTNAVEIETPSSKEITNVDKTEIINNKEIVDVSRKEVINKNHINDGGVNERLSNTEMPNVDKTEILKSKEFANVDERKAKMKKQPIDVDGKEINKHFPS